MYNVTIGISEINIEKFSTGAFKEQILVTSWLHTVKALKYNIYRQIFKYLNHLSYRNFTDKKVVLTKN